MDRFEGVLLHLLPVHPPTTTTISSSSSSSRSYDDNLASADSSRSTANRRLRPTTRRRLSNATNNITVLISSGDSPAAAAAAAKQATHIPPSSAAVHLPRPRSARHGSAAGTTGERSRWLRHFAAADWALSLHRRSDQRDPGRVGGRAGPAGAAGTCRHRPGHRTHGDLGGAG